MQLMPSRLLKSSILDEPRAVQQQLKIQSIQPFCAEVLKFKGNQKHKKSMQNPS